MLRRASLALLLDLLRGRSPPASTVPGTVSELRSLPPVVTLAALLLLLAAVLVVGAPSVADFTAPVGRRTGEALVARVLEVLVELFAAVLEVAVGGRSWPGRGSSTSVYFRNVP
jgi:membrane protein implicated in regulation of membrane protease activity